jgi:hypothetical protein
VEIGAIPLPGSAVPATLDAIIAATVTRRVGAMISTHYQSGERWIESRHHRYELTRLMTGWSLA